MTTSLFAETERALALDALLKDLMQCLGEGAPALCVAVSGCAGGDFVARPVEAGFELLVAAGRDTDACDHLLGCVARELDVIEYCGAFAGLFAEEGGVDSPAGFIRRVGIRYVQERIARDPAGRAALFQRVFHGRRRSGTRCIARLASA